MIKRNSHCYVDGWVCYSKAALTQTRLGSKVIIKIIMIGIRNAKKICCQKLLVYYGKLSLIKPVTQRFFFFEALIIILK